MAIHPATSSDGRVVVKKSPKKIWKNQYGEISSCRLTMECIYCKKSFSITSTEFGKGCGRYCSYKCSARCPERIKKFNISRPDMSGVSSPSYKNGKYLYRQHKKSFCEICGIRKEELLLKKKYKKDPMHVHHLDGNWNNCSAKNLLTLCASCHVSQHWKSKNRKSNGWEKRKRKADGTFTSITYLS
jgi:hypothetical protein